MEKLEHVVRFERGFDCIRFECVNGSDKCIPHEGGSHGKHGMGIRFVSKGEEGAVQFLLQAGWMPQWAEESSIKTRDIQDWGSYAMPFDLGYHSKAPRYEDQTPMQDECEWCDGQPCYYDGSGLNATDPMYALVNGGEEALWKFLDAYYECTFRDGQYPTPAEYPHPLRKGAWG